MNTLVKKPAAINNIMNEAPVKDKSKSKLFNNINKRILFIAVSVIALFASGVTLVCNIHGRMNIAGFVGYCLIAAGILALITIIAVLIAERSEKSK